MPGPDSGNTDSGNTASYDTDKGPGYLQHYERAIGHLRDQPVRLLELGIFRGGSLLMWADYFPKGEIAGLDIDQVVVEHPRVRVYQGPQQDQALLDRIAAEVAPDGFDVIIDDASHFGSHTAASFAALYDRHLKPGGVYVIEDWGTGYWPSWPDGKAFHAPDADGRPAVSAYPGLAARRALTPVLRATEGRGAPGRVLARWAGRFTGHVEERVFPSHDVGMVGFVKQLVDLTSKTTDPPHLGEPPPRIAQMWISDGQVFCFKPGG